jgi:hypothetical protein
LWRAHGVANGLLLTSMPISNRSQAHESLSSAERGGRIPPAPSASPLSPGPSSAYRDETDVLAKPAGSCDPGTAVTSPDLVASDPTNAERQARYKARRKGLIPAPIRLDCPSCGKIHTGARGAMCARCWEKHTVEGRAYKAARVAKTYARKKQASAIAGNSAQA